MDAVTIFFLAIVAFFIWRGYQKGFIGSITRPLSWLIAYPTAIIFTKPLAALLIQHTALDGMMVYFIAGAVLFLGVSVLVAGLLNGLAKLVPRNATTDTGSKAAGASVGLLVGSVIGLLAVYGITLIKKPAPTDQSTQELAHTHSIASTPSEPSGHTAKLHSANTQSPTAKVPHIKDLDSAKDSFIETSAKKLIGSVAATAVDVALDDSTATQVTKAFVQDPQTMLGHVQHVVNDGKMKALLADESIQSQLTTGDVHQLMDNPGFQDVMSNEHMQALVATADNTETGTTGRQATAEKMIAAWQRVNHLKHDPRIIAIINDPEFQQQLNSPNKLSLMMNPKLNQLAELIFSQETQATNGMGNYKVHGYEVHDYDKHSKDEPGSAQYSNPADPATENKPPTKIYRWTDADGNVHYSDRENNPP